MAYEPKPQRFQYGNPHDRDREERKRKGIKYTSADLADANEAARQRYEAMLAHVITTFYLEPQQHDHEKFEVIDGTTERGQQVATLFATIPFPCIRICQTVVNDDGTRCDSEVICWGDGTQFGWLSRDRNPDTGSTAYFPNGLMPSIDRSFPMSYENLMAKLANNSARYVERPVSRQERRRNGYAEGYCEYIVIDKPTKDERKSAMRLTAILRRHPRLHAVRGHIRRYRTGLVTRVRAHARGKGKLFQVKDYITEEAYYSGA